MNLAGGDGGDHFYAGERTDGAGDDIDHVRLRFADGPYPEDDTAPRRRAVVPEPDP